MLVWQPEQLSALTAAVDEARQGRPTVLAVTGDAGAGKTVLLNELVQRASDFAILSAEGSEDDRMPFAVLSQWGVAPGGGVGTEPFIIAQELRRVIDAVGDQPLLLKLDDLHWADTESVDALVWVLRRSIGDRLLVAVGSRRLAEDQHASWQRWMSSRSNQVTELDLTGLSSEQFGHLLEATEIALPDAAAAALLDHTGGNPLHLQALLHEYDVDELTSSPILPAPAALAKTVAARMDRLSDPARRLLAASAVVGAGWQPLRTVTSVAELAEPTAALDELVTAGFVHVHRDPVDLNLRLEHALVHSAVYASLSLVERQRLHAQAATQVEDEGASLDHRISASDELDPVLAKDLENYALRLRQRRAWPLAAYYLRAAAARTQDDALWRQRLLEAAFCSGLVPDAVSMARELDRIPMGGSEQESVARAFLLIRQGERTAGAEALRDLLQRDDLEEVAQYRASVLAAWSMMESDAPWPEVDRVLRIADRSDASDPALEFHHRSTRTFTDQMMLTPTEHWRRQDSTLGASADVPLSRSWELAQRAIVAARVGLFERGRDDLAELMRRGQEGMFPGWDARVPAGLGYMQWLVGDWTGARVSLAIAQEASGHDLYLPLILVGEGRIAEARELLEQQESRLGSDRADPLYMNHRLGLIMAAHAQGDSDLRRRLGDELAPELGADLRADPRRSRIMPLMTGIAAYWARDADLARDAARLLEEADPPIPWGPATGQWFRGLGADIDGNQQAVHAHLAAAARDHRMNLPLFRAHILVDHAESSGVRGDFDAAATSLAAAKAIYAELGARQYLARIDKGWPAEAQAPARTAPSIQITERERDVLSLALSGLSYAQIGQELFITQKTVGYHLSNLYAKANVSGRHELIQVARDDPGIFQLDVSPPLRSVS